MKSSSKPSYLFGLSMVGALAVVATAAFVSIAFFGEKAENRDLSGLSAGLAESALNFPAEEIIIASSVEVPEPVDSLAGFDHPGDSLVADVKVPKLQVFDSPGGKVSRTLSNPTVENAPLILGVKERQGDWILAQLPIRPNGTTGWVKQSDVTTRSVPNHIVVQVGNRMLSAFRGTELLMEEPVAVGTPRTPTPVGEFYVDISLRNPPPSLGLGVHMLSISGFSDVLRNFGGGVGQLAIHGTSNLGSIGEFSSNGCVRLPNDVVVELAKIAPTGTPVFILP